MWRIIRAGSVALVIFCCTVTAQTAQAQVSVGIGVGDTYLEVSGQTSPNAFVTIKDGDNVVGTLSANDDGSYTKLLPAQTPGLHYIGVYAKDSAGRISDSAVFNINVREFETTAVEVFLPTTMELSGNVIQNGGNLYVRGETIPGGTVSLTLDQSTLLQTTADSDGHWSIQLSPSQITPGNHSVYGSVTDADGTQSFPTSPRFFTTVAPNLPSKPGSPPPQIPIPFQPPPESRPQTPAAPRITAPRSGASAKTAEITVIGLGNPNQQIEIWRNNRLLGSVFTDRVGGWYMNVLLQNGSNELKARACLRDVCSPFSEQVRVQYDADQPLAAQLRLILSAYRFNIAAGESIGLSVTAANGRGPYEYVIDWGDGSVQRISGESDTTSANHRYASAGQFSGNVLVQSSDGQQRRAYFTTEVVSADRSVIPAIISVGLLSLTALIASFRGYLLARLAIILKK